MPKSYRIVVHVRVPLRKAALFVTPPFSAVKTPLWCIIPSRHCFPVQRPSFYPANSLMAQCIWELRERDIPEPYTFNPQPEPKLQNLSTSPKTLNPKPRPLNPTPELNQNLDTGPKPRIVDPQVRGSGPLLRSLSLSLWHKQALSKDCSLQACSRKGSDLETTRDTTTAAAVFYALEFILRDHFYISEPRERGPTHLPPDKGEPRNPSKNRNTPQDPSEKLPLNPQTYALKP